MTRPPGVVAYPVTAVWATGVAVAIAVAQDWVDLGTGLTLLSGVSVLIYMVALRHEVTSVRQLVNGQRTELLARIDTLVDYLVDAGLRLPPGESGEQPAHPQEPRSDR